MLGTFTNGTGYSADVYGYDIAGKTGTTETSFDVNLINDQWIIGYTPDLVISQWVGYEKTDENHYIDGSTSWMAPVVFQTVAGSLLLWQNTGFTVKNAYALNGLGQPIQLLHRFQPMKLRTRLTTGQTAPRSFWIKPRKILLRLTCQIRPNPYGIPLLACFNSCQMEKNMIE